MDTTRQQLIRERRQEIRGLIFDFDGLIIDTELPDFQSWHELYECYGCNLSFEHWSGLIGTTDHTFNPYDELEAQLGHTVDREVIRTQRRSRYAELIALEVALPGVREYVTAARHLGLRLGIASSSPREWVTDHLERLGLDEHFDVMACRDDVMRSKPDPAVYQVALTSLGLRADQVIALEDSPNGVAAARGAGLFCIAVPNRMTRHLSTADADLHLTSLADLPLESLLQIVGQGHERDLL